MIVHRRVSKPAPLDLTAIAKVIDDALRIFGATPLNPSKYQRPPRQLLHSLPNDLLLNRAVECRLEFHRPDKRATPQPSRDDQTNAIAYHRHQAEKNRAQAN